MLFYIYWKKDKQVDILKLACIPSYAFKVLCSELIFQFNILFQIKQIFYKTFLEWFSMLSTLIGYVNINPIKVFLKLFFTTSPSYNMKVFKQRARNKLLFLFLYIILNHGKKLKLVPIFQCGLNKLLIWTFLNNRLWVQVSQMCAMPSTSHWQSVTATLTSSALT